MAFTPLTQEETATLLPAAATSGFTPLNSEFALRGSIGTEVPSSAAADISAARVLARENAQVGVFPEQNQVMGAISRGLLEGSTAGLGQATLEKSITQDRFDPNSPQFTDPYTFGISEIIGSFAPVGRITQAALKGKALLTGATQGGKAVVAAAPNLIKTGATTGLVYGAAGGEAEALRKNQDILDQLSSTAVGGTKGLVVGGVTGGLIKKVQASRMDPTETFLSFVKPKVGSKAQTETLNFTDSGKLEQAVGSVKNFFKIPKNITTEQARDLTTQAGEKLFAQVDDIVAQFPAHRLLGSRLQEGLQREVLDNPLLKALSPGTQKELTDAAAEIASDRTLKQAIALQKKLNKRFKSTIKSRNSGGDPKLNDELEFLDTLRRENSKLIDDAITGLTGINDNPYRRWGAVSELENIIEARFGTLRNIVAQNKQKGVGAKLKDIKNLDFKGNEMKSSDNLISNLFNKIPEYQITPLLPRVANQRLSRSVQAPAAPPVQLTPQQLQNQRMAQSVSSGGLPQVQQSVVSGPILGVTPANLPASFTAPGFAPPPTQTMEAFIQRLMQEQIAAGASQQEAARIVNQRIAQSIAAQARSGSPSGTVSGPILGVTPTSLPASLSTPGFAPPSAPTMEAAIQRLMQEQVAAGATQLEAAQALNLRMAQIIDQARAVPQVRINPANNPGPILGVTPVQLPASMSSPGFTPPVNQEALIQQLLQENEALKAAQQGTSTVSFF